ncbi:MAG: hypothetical protein AMXMBFR53_34600 [Gemmatimonadota bacterium]
MLRIGCLTPRALKADTAPAGAGMVGGVRGDVPPEGGSRAKHVERASTATRAPPRAGARPPAPRPTYQTKGIGRSRFSAARSMNWGVYARMCRPPP